MDKPSAVNEKIQKTFYSNQFFIVTNLFYLMNKPSAANKKFKNVLNFLFHGPIYQKWFYILISENNDAWRLFFMCYSRRSLSRTPVISNCHYLELFGRCLELFKQF